MNPFDAINEDERFAFLIAHYSEVINEGGEVDLSADPSLSTQLKERLERALRLVRQLHLSLRSPASSDSWVIKSDITVHDGVLGGQVGRFRIDRLLGHGGGGIVLLAFDPELRREVALKIPHLPALLAPEMGRRFLREARAAAQLDHPNLVPIYEVAEANGVCFLVSAYCRGGSLDQWLAVQTTPVPVCQTTQWLAELADAVQYAHSHGIYHRDIKPGNILLDLRTHSPNDEQTFVPRLSDFGLAKLHDAQTASTRSGTVLGTASYMAPEQIEGRLRDIGPATDVYGLGAVLYEILTGRPPFRGVTDADTVRQVLENDPEPPRSLRLDMPSDLQTICLKCLEKEPARRYAGAAELADDLRRFLAHEPIAARPLRRLEHLRKWFRRRPAKTILLVSSLLVVLILVIGWLQLASLEQARDTDLAAMEKQTKERQEAIRQRDQSLRQLHYAEDIALAWHTWENHRQENITGLLDKYLPSSGQDKADDLRGFEWYFLSRLSHARPLMIRHPYLLHSVAFSPDGTTCAACQRDGVIALWNPVSGRKVGILEGHSFGTFRLAYSPDGQYLASGSSHLKNDGIEGELRLWDARTREMLSEFARPLGDVLSLDFSPDGKTLATVCFVRIGKSEVDVTSEVKFLEIPSLKLRRQIPFPAPSAVSAAFSSDGTVLTIGHVNGNISLVDAVTGQVVETHSRHHDCIWSVACGHKNATFVLGANDGRVRICSLRPGCSVLAEYLHEGAVHLVAMSPDDRIVASISRGMLKVWDCENHREHFSRTLQGVGSSVAFSPDGKSLAVGIEDGRLWIYDILRSSDGRVWINDDSPSVETLSWLGHRDGNEPCEAWAVTFSPDSKTLASAGDDHNIRLWDPATGRELTVLRGHQSLVTSLAFSPDGKWLASGSFDVKGPVKLWEASSGKCIVTLNGHNNSVDGLAFSPDSKTLATAGRDRVARLWDIATLKDQPILSGHVESLAFSPDGRTLAMDNVGKAPSLWDMQEHTVRRTLPPHRPGHVAVAFSPDGKTFVTGGYEGTVRFFDADTGELRLSSRSHSEAVNCLAFSPDSKTLASASFDRKVKLWQTATGRELLTLPEQKERVRWLAFSPDGTMLATAGHDGVLKIYRAGSDHEVQHSR